MVCFHLFIISTFPLAVPLEWNVLFAYATIFLFLGFPAWDGYARGRHVPAVAGACVIVAALLFFPVLGNLRPDMVSFLPSMRQYAGNWASAVWAFAPGAEAKLERGHPLGARTRSTSSSAFGYEPQWAEITMQQTIAWRTMHSQGRGLFSVLLKTPARHRHPHRARGRVRLQLADRLQLRRRPPARRGPDRGRPDARRLRARRARRRLGGVAGLVAASCQHYQVIDAALGVIERGTWKVADAVAEQPWLPNGPIPTDVTWSLRRQRAAPSADREHDVGHGALA